MSFSFAYVGWACIGACIGMLFMAWCSRMDRRQIERQKDDVVRFYHKALDKADDAEKELRLKQRVLDTQNEEIHRLRRIVKQLKKQREEATGHDC